MTSYVVDAEPIRIDLEPAANGRPQWVEIRGELSIGDQDTMTARMFAVRLDKNKLTLGGEKELTKEQITAALDFDMDMGSASGVAAKLETWLTDWQLYRRDGTDLPFTSESIRSLSPKLGDILLARINALEASGKADGAPASLTAIAP